MHFGMLFRVEEGVLLNNDSRKRGIKCVTLKRKWYLIMVTKFSRPGYVLSAATRGFAVRQLGWAAPR